MSRPLAAVAILGALLLGGVPAVAQSPAPTSPAGQSAVPIGSPSPGDLMGARTVCEEKTGTVQVREAMFGTNASDHPSDWLDLGRSIELCRFQAEDGSAIFVDTLTLASPGPTLASVAYLSKVKMPAYDPNKGDPSTAYCRHLTGSSAYGPGASGGGWVDTSDKDFPVVNMCVFADGSMIDEWGLAYHSDGTVRGIDLAQQFVYQPKDGLPPIF